MKLQLKLLIGFCVIIVISGLLLITQIIPEEKYPDADYNSGEIQKVHIIINTSLPGIYYTSEFDITSEAGINTVISCIKQSKDYEKKSVETEMLPEKYTVIYTFKSGAVKSIEHSIVPTTLVDPLSELLDLDEVIKQINPFFHVKDTEISIASINYSPEGGAFLQRNIEKKEDIQYLLDIAKEDALLNKNNKGHSRCGITFLGENYEDILCGFEIDNNTYKLSEIRGRIPEIDEIITIAEKKQYQ